MWLLLQPLPALFLLAILGLKCYHMEREALRTEAGREHCARCRERLAVLREQRRDLAGCLQ